MRLLDITLSSPEENLALDEALLCQDDGPDALRLWEPSQPLVVLGRSSRLEEEVDVAACESTGVPILRRVSGGATIVTGPGCLMYAIVLSKRDRPELGMVDHAHGYVLDRLANALSAMRPTVTRAGTSDLAFRESAHGPLLKFSGNSVRLTRSRLLYHGTLLYDADLDLIRRLLREPPRQPDYRLGRPHGEFIANLPVERSGLHTAITTAFPTTHRNGLDNPLATDVSDLVRERYGCAGWNLSR